MKKLILTILSLMLVFLLVGCDNYEEENNQLNKQIEEYKLELNSLNSEIVLLESQIRSLEETVSSKEGLIENLQSQILLMVDAKNTMDNLIEQLENNIENLNNRYKKISEDMKIAIDKYKDDITSLQEEKTLLENEKTSLTAEINRMTQASYELTITYEQRIQLLIEEYNQQISDLNLEIESLNSDISFLSEGDLSGKLYQQNLLINELRTTITTLEILAYPLVIESYGEINTNFRYNGVTYWLIDDFIIRNISSRNVYKTNYTIILTDKNGYTYETKGATFTYILMSPQDLPNIGANSVQKRAIYFIVPEQAEFDHVEIIFK